MLAAMFDDVAKEFLHGRLKTVREVLVWKVEALSEYDIRRPLTETGTNLLGLVKHMATCESWYFGLVFGRPSPEPLGRWQDADGSDLWVTADETREQVIDFYRRAAKHSDATIGELPLDTPGDVPWWPGAEVTLFGVMVHVLQEATRHAGHADILREQLDGRTGLRPGLAGEIDTTARVAHRARVERAALAAAGGEGSGTEAGRHRGPAGSH